MASLTGQSINTTYNGLLKSSNNAALPSGGAVSFITDGEGNATGFGLGQGYIGIEPINGGHIYDQGAENGFYFTPSGVVTSGSWDFSSSTVTGLPGGGGLAGASNMGHQTHSGPDGADTVFASVLVPANTFTTGDIVKLEANALLDLTGGGWIYGSIWVSSSATVLTGTNITQHETPSITMWFNSKTLFIHSADGTGNGTAVFGTGADNATDQSSNGNATFADNAALAIDWTSDVYFNYMTFVENTGSSITNKGMYVTKVNS